MGFTGILTSPNSIQVSNVQLSMTTGSNQAQGKVKNYFARGRWWRTQVSTYLGLISMTLILPIVITLVQNIKLIFPLLTYPPAQYVWSTGHL